MKIAFVVYNERLMKVLSDLGVDYDTRGGPREGKGTRDG